MWFYSVVHIFHKLLKVPQMAVNFLAFSLFKGVSFLRMRNPEVTLQSVYLFVQLCCTQTIASFNSLNPYFKITWVKHLFILILFSIITMMSFLNKIYISKNLINYFLYPVSCFLLILFLPDRFFVSTFK